MPHIRASGMPKAVAERVFGVAVAEPRVFDEEDGQLSGDMRVDLSRIAGQEHALFQRDAFKREARRCYNVRCNVG